MRPGCAGYDALASYPPIRSLRPNMLSVQQPDTNKDVDVAVFYGTRPQIVKASRLVAALRTRLSVVAVDTGQHYDYQLNGLLYEQLTVRPADLFLEVGSGTHAQQTADVVVRSADIISSYKPRCVVVVGDTNSTLGAALAAVKLRTPVVHVEAGLRSGDPLMAEELNRRIVDAISGLLCAPSSLAAATLASESPSGTIVMTGDIARDVLQANCSRAPSVVSIAGWPFAQGAPFIFCTLHRAELTADMGTLRTVLETLDNLPVGVIMAVHPRTRGVIASLDFQPSGSLVMRDPLGYLETVACIRDAATVVTDSGGVQREAYWLGTPCVTVRGETEWTETVKCGANTLVAPRAVASDLQSTVARSIESEREWDRDAYGDGHAADAITAATCTWLGA